MKNYLFSVLQALFISGCSTDSLTITLRNSSAVPLVDQPVVLNRSDFHLSENQYIIFTIDEDVIPAQFDDLNNDGVWDEVALEITFPADADLNLQYRVVQQSELPEFEIKTAVHLGYSPNRDNNFKSVASNVRPSDHIAQSTPYLYQYEGPGWESDKVAFRAYFDSRNGKDIFGKTKPDLVVHEIGLGENYHELQDWGMDVLKVGASLGSGGLAILKNDSIYRLTDTDLASFKVVSEGPIRSVITLSYEGWQVGGERFDAIEKISIWAGKRHYQSEVSLSGNGLDTLVTGIVDLKAMEAKTIENEASKTLYTHGAQSENKDALGMALIVPNEALISFGSAPDEGRGVTNTYTALIRPVDGIYKYCFYAGWELEDPSFAEESSFVDMLTSETTAMINPIKTTE